MLNETLLQNDTANFVTIAKNKMYDVERLVNNTKSILQSIVKILQSNETKNFLVINTQDAKEELKFVLGLKINQTIGDLERLVGRYFENGLKEVHMCINIF